MEFELKSDYINISDYNTMIVDDRIKNAFEVSRNVYYEGVDYDPKFVLYNYIPQKVFIDFFRHTTNKLIRIHLIIGICVLLFSCGGSNSRSKRVDDSIKQLNFNHWSYNPDKKQPLDAIIYSQNYYTTNNNENVYGGISLGVDNQYSCIGLIMPCTIGGDNKKQKTLFYVPPTQRHFAISFDGGGFRLWPAYPTDDCRALIIDECSQFIDDIMQSRFCSITYVTTDGEFTFDFDIKGLHF